MKTLIGYALLVLMVGGTVTAQTRLGQLQTRAANATDSTMVFTSPRKEKPVVPDAPAPLRQSYGIDVMLSANGYGLGGFYRREYSRDLYGILSLAITDVKDDNEVEQYDYYTGETYVPNKINRFLMLPLFAGVEYRLFADDILDTFRPYVNAGAGPAMIISSPYELEYFNSLFHHSTFYYTGGGYVGFGAYFGSERGSLMGVNFRYYYIPVSGGINSMVNPLTNAIMKKNDFGGFYITINIGSSY